MIEFPVSGVETYWWLPPLVAFLISCITATGGLSGAFLLLPFQVSVLGYTASGVSPTNLLFSIVGIPFGVYRYCSEGRMIWPLSWVIILGTVPGMFLGALIRVYFLPDLSHFKLFVALVLAAIGINLLLDVIRNRRASKVDINRRGSSKVSDIYFSKSIVSYRFQGEYFSVSTPKISLLGLFVGIVGGAYGIGGGAIMVPLIVSVMGLPVYTIAGAVLFSTFIGSIGGVISYLIIGLTSVGTYSSVSPDWALGGLLGIGGAVGMYVGARLQRFIPARLIKVMLTVCLLGIAVKYLSVLFF